MKILKRILIVLAIIVALPFIVALFVNGNYAVERQVVINKPKSEVFSYIKYLKNQNEYSVWAKIDPNMKPTFKGVDGTVGFISAWESDNKNVGKGEQEIVSIKEGEKVETVIRFKVPFESEDRGYMTTVAIDSTQTKVIWGFNGKMKYPMNLFLLLTDVNGSIGADLSKGLNNLKAILESK